MKYIIVTVSLLFWNFVGAGVSAEDQPPKPKIQIEAAEYDFGSVTQGTKVTHDFVVLNTGTQDLTLQRVVAACGCTAVSSSTAPIPPGGKGTIHVEFDTAGFSGEKLKNIRVYSNDTDNPSQLLTLKGVVEPDITVEPRNVFFNDVMKGNDLEAQTKEITIKIRPGAKVRITSIKNNSKYLLLKELETKEDTRRVSVALDPSVPLGELRERLIIGLTDGAATGETSINVPIFASVKGQVQLKPAQLSFGVIEGSQDLVRTVKLENMGKDPIHIKELKTSSPAVTASAKVIQDGKQYLIQVKIDPAKVSRDLRASVDVVTDSESEGTLSLNIYGILPPKV